ncbi:siderophore ABC transporter substrate-binding protein [Lampropedia puyangensis]|uniref:Siderophore ABC transporter substrate-binding protein n=2 Tax=Lampropedia puyangensis TaxID=1330072 RepID=A0A4S8F207_9BURK|nr:siderophore ABC transporter substrate-binding protein [Lampropedia puyangensis]
MPKVRGVGRIVGFVAAAVLAMAGVVGQQVYAQGAPAATAAGAMAQAGRIDFKHAKGEESLPLNPKKVVVFDLATLDMLQALGVDAVVGVPAFKMPSHLKSYEGDTYTKVGSLFEPNYEAIRALSPDVIFIGRRSEPRYAELKKLAPTVDMAIDEGHAVESVFSNLRKLAELFGKQDKAQILIEQTQAEIDSLKAVTPSAGKAMLLLVSGGRINSYGPGSRMGVIFDAFGVQPAQAASGDERHGQSISFEFILQSNPDWLLVLDRDSAIGREGAAAERLLDNALIKATNAGKKGQIVYLNAMNWYVLDNAGITALRDNVRQLHEVFSKATPAVH